MAQQKLSVLDPLYGTITFKDELAELILSPVLQRLRHIRLSNIDSIDLPGIANVSRFEHVLGVGYLATTAGLFDRLSRIDRVILGASALLHDAAITSFGHLVEEAFQYVGAGFNHEQRLYQILSGEATEELGGINRQVFAGRETGLGKWGRKIAGSGAENDLIRAITENIHGMGQFGRVVSGEIDLDNMDNVFRMAYHMGLPIDREAPRRLARSIIDVRTEDKEPLFCRSAVHDIELWLSTRRAVYEHLMLANGDFAGKLMMLYATVVAFQENEIAKVDWALTDDEFLQRLLSSKTNEIRETVRRWCVGELWDTVPLHWMAGQRPQYSKLLSFSQMISKSLRRPCFAYGIKDKRDRHLLIRFEDGSTRGFGSDVSQWLLGAGSSTRRKLTASEGALVFELAADFFETHVIGKATDEAELGGLGSSQPCLF
jgi:HD superfamily phosphohydrolase